MRILCLAASLVLAGLSLAAAPPHGKPGQPASKPHQATPGNPAATKGDPYSITVPVDASAASASVAQNNAINSGRTKAWAELSHRLVPQKDWGKLPPLDNAALERMVRGYSVSNEKRSTTRYVARITYVFNPNAVKHLLRVANLGASEPSGSAILLVAMSPSYSAHSAWAQALSRKYPGVQIPLVNPVGDAVDQSTLGPVRFADGSWAQIQPAAARVHAGEAVLVQASSPAASKMTIRMRRVGPNSRMIALGNIEVPVAAGTPPEKAYAAAAEQAEAAINDAWKNKPSIDLSKRSKMVAEVRIGSLADWVTMLSRISGIASVSDITVLALNSGEARVAFSYAGGPDQLRAAAAQSNLSLADRGGSWWIGNGTASDSDSDPGALE